MMTCGWKLSSIFILTLGCLLEIALDRIPHIFQKFSLAVSLAFKDTVLEIIDFPPAQGRDTGRQPATAAAPADKDDFLRPVYFGESARDLTHRYQLRTFDMQFGIFFRLTHIDDFQLILLVPDQVAQLRRIDFFDGHSFDFYTAIILQKRMTVFH